VGARDDRNEYECTVEERRAFKTYVKLMRAADSATARIHSHLAPRGLTLSQFGVLEALYSLGPLCQKELGEKILKTSGNVTLVVDNLEKQDLVRRERNAEDRRFVTVSLTDKGHRLIQEMFPRHAGAVREEMAVLTPSEQEELGRLCRKLGKQEKTA
jgi:MarR family 2-MHQ and catechol resistance regulon transcriptional repressor